MKIFEPAVKPKNKILEGGGRKPLDLQLQHQLVELIYDWRSNGLRVLRKLIMTKAKYFYGSECDESKKSLFEASNGWVKNLMRHNGFSLRRKTTTPAGNYMFKVNNRNTRTRCEICSKLTIKTPERR